MQSSSVTVAILGEPTVTDLAIDPGDLTWSTCRSGGPGGQSVNTTNSAVILRHEPSGLTVRIESERSQHQNRAIALGVLRARLVRAQDDLRQHTRNTDRKTQVGSGERGDKVRTYRYKDRVATDHRTGKKVSLDRILKGELDLLR